MGICERVHLPVEQEGRLSLLEVLGRPFFLLRCLVMGEHSYLMSWVGSFNVWHLWFLNSITMPHSLLVLYFFWCNQWPSRPLIDCHTLCFTTICSLMYLLQKCYITGISWSVCQGVTDVWQSFSVRRRLAGLFPSVFISADHWNEREIFVIILIFFLQLSPDNSVFSSISTAYEQCLK